MTTKRIPILAYRDVLLAPSQTFIPEQMESLVRFRAWYTGTRIAPTPLVPQSSVILPSRKGQLGGVERTLFRAAAIVPRHWFAAIAAVRPVLVHAHFGLDGALALPLAKRLNLPLVVTFWGQDIMVRSDASLSYAIYRKLFLPRVFRGASMLIAVSEPVRLALIEAGAPADRIRVHHVGVDTVKFSPRDTPKENFVLFVGRLTEKKGCGDLISAMKTVQQVHPGLRLVIAGDGALRRELEIQASADLVNYDFLGLQSHENVRDLMSRAFLVAAPSRTASNGDAEGLPIVITEAQSMEVPVVSTWHSGIPEAIVDGETGLLVREGDVEELTRAIIRCVENPEFTAQMGRAGRAHMVKHFQLSRQTEQLERVYDEVLN